MHNPMQYLHGYLGFTLMCIPCFLLILRSMTRQPTQTNHSHGVPCALGSSLGEFTMSTINQVTISFQSAHVQALASVRTGKVSASNEKAAALLNSSDKQTIVSAALTSRGAVGKTAKTALLSSVKTLETLLSCAALDGSEWGNLLTLLAGEFGVDCFNRATMSGKAGCERYIALTVQALEVKFSKCETVKAQQRVMPILQQALDAQANVKRLIDAAEQQRRAAEQQESAGHQALEQESAEQQESAAA